MLGSTINPEVVAAIKYFYEEVFFRISINATFVALIPEKVGVMELNEFRPVILVGREYKIIAKLLTERLKRVMHKIVDRQHMAFIKNKIMDAIAITNKCADSR